MNKIVITALAAVLLGGCATAERVATRIEAEACDPDPLNQLARHTARVQGFEATGGKYLVVGFCEGENDFEEAKLRWLDPYTGQDADLKLYLYNKILEEGGERIPVLGEYELIKKETTE